MIDRNTILPVFDDIKNVIINSSEIVSYQERYIDQLLDSRILWTERSIRTKCR